MRLTLRTLLAYLEGVLEPQDKEDLERQIDSSDNATELIHRTRDVMQRLRLGAPTVLGSSASDDPNTMAEYIDSTLPDQQVADFERICLESDMMLAEAAACQHAIAMALESRPPIDSDTRRRLHELPEMLADLEHAKSEHERARAAAEQARADDDPEPEIPDYLKSKESIPWAAWIMATAAVLLLSMTVYLIGTGPQADSVAKNDPQANDRTPVEERESTNEASDGSSKVDQATETDPETESDEPIDPIDPDNSEGEPKPEEPNGSDQTPGETPADDSVNENPAGTDPEESKTDPTPPVDGPTTAEPTETESTTSEPTGGTDGVTEPATSGDDKATNEDQVAEP